MRHASSLFTKRKNIISEIILPEPEHAATMVAMVARAAHKLVRELVAKRSSKSRIPYANVFAFHNIASRIKLLKKDLRNQQQQLPTPYFSREETLRNATFIQYITMLGRTYLLLTCLAVVSLVALLFNFDLVLPDNYLPVVQKDDMVNEMVSELGYENALVTGYAFSNGSILTLAFHLNFFLSVRGTQVYDSRLPELHLRASSIPGVGSISYSIWWEDRLRS
jgi:hypothetical protein